MSRTVPVTVKVQDWVTADVPLEDIDSASLVDELTERKLTLPFDHPKRHIEQLYYATRGNSWTEETLMQVRDLIAELYGRLA